MIVDRLLQQAGAAPGPALPRRRFLAATATVGGLLGLGLWPAAGRAQGAARPGSRPHEQPRAFVSIARDGTVTVLCNRLDMGQGIETALAMACAEELDADWSRVVTGFGNQQGAYVDPAMGMHLTGGSNSVKNSHLQYRELGARTRAMLLAAASQQWGVPVAQLKAAQGVVAGGGRQAGYGELFEAAMAQPVPEAVTLKPAAEFRLLGKPQALTVARAKSDGTQRYAIDVRLPGMLTAVIQRPPVFNGRVAGFDAAAARRVKGVVEVFPVALDRGGQGLAVVAEGYWPAKLGRDALKVDWALAEAPRADTEALRREYLALAQKPGTPAPQPGLRAAAPASPPAGGTPRTIAAEFVFPYLNHAQLEPLCCTVDLQADRAVIHAASQMPGVDAAAAASVLGLKPEQVEIVVQMAGGGFGRRATPSGEWVREAAAVARGLAERGRRAPVKVLWSREDDMAAGYYRPFTVHRAEIGFDAAGKVLSWEHRVVSQSILAGSPFEAFMVQQGVDVTTVEGLREPYALPMNVSVHHPKVNVPVLWWRAVGSTHTAYVMETLIDEIATATRQDPVAYRMALMGSDAKAARHKAALQLAVEASGYGRRKLPAGTAWGVAVHESFGSVVAYVVEAALRGRGAERRPVLTRVTAGVHCNFCVNPRSVAAQVEGSVLMALATTLPGHAITLKDGRVEQTNFDRFTLPRLAQMPRVDVHVVPSAEPPTGMGEPALPPLAPAFANAVARLTGRRQRELPFRWA
ncbi:MAG: molybdopterin-dependent oxidoreductase [Burkholderiaceae bacterium]|nr:molybdopterin-dependent oxidoreductase [Burkholderiaceae bacterium]